MSDSKLRSTCSVRKVDAVSSGHEDTSINHVIKMEEIDLEPDYIEFNSDVDTEMTKMENCDLILASPSSGSYGGAEEFNDDKQTVSFINNNIEGSTFDMNLHTNMEKRNEIISHDFNTVSRNPSFMKSHHSLRENNISDVVNYGSDDDSDEDGSAETESNPIFIPRVARICLQADDEEDEVQPDAILSFQWPPQPLQPQPISIPTLEPEQILKPEATRESPPDSEFTAEFEPSLFPEFEPTSKFAFDWRGFSTKLQIPPESRREPFSSLSGPNIVTESPYHAFTAIWDRDIMENIARETNRYAEQVATQMIHSGTMRSSSRITKWRPTNADELYTYFAIILATGVQLKTRIDEYWDKTDDIFITPRFSTFMSLDRFLLLNKCLHFKDNHGCTSDTITWAEAKIFKVQPIVHHLNKKFGELYCMSRNIVLDKSVTQGIDINQPTICNNSIKTYEVCDSETGYLYKFEIHTGNEHTSNPNNPVSGCIPALVLRLLNGLEHKGHTVWMDNYFNSPALARELKIQGFDCVGTLRTNRQFVPTELTTVEKTDMAIGQIFGCTAGDVDIVVMRDKKRLALISTYHGLETVRCGGVLKPSIITDYLICMGRVDRKDQTIAQYPIERMCSGIWYKKLFRRLLNVSVFNAFVIFKEYHSISHRRFRKELVVDLLRKHGSTRLTPVVTGGHFPAQYKCVSNKRHERKRRFCIVCRKRTSAYCKGCNVPMCVYTCFGPHHNALHSTIN